MNKKFVLIFLLLFLISFINIKAQEIQARKIEEGPLDPNEPVMYKDILILGTEGAEVTEDGSIKGKVILPEINNIEIQNIDNFQYSPEGFKGIAAKDSIVAGHMLGKGTVFIYDKNTRELLIPAGGSITKQWSDSKKEEITIYGKPITTSEGVSIYGTPTRVTKDGTIILPKGTELKLSYYGKDLILPLWLKRTETKIFSRGDTELELTETATGLSRKYRITGEATVVNGKKEEFKSINVNGEGIIYFGYFQRNEGPYRVDLEDKGPSEFEFIGDVRTIVSNQIIDPNTKRPINKRIVIGFGYVDKPSYIREPSVDYVGFPEEESKNYDGVVLIRQGKHKLEGRAQIDVEGQASVNIGNFDYSGQSREVKTTIRSAMDFVAYEINHPPLEEKTPVASLDLGGLKRSLVMENNRIRTLQDTASTLSRGETNVVSGDIAGSKMEVDVGGTHITDWRLDGGTVTRTFPPFYVRTLPTQEEIKETAIKRHEMYEEYKKDYSHPMVFFGSLGIPFLVYSILDKTPEEFEKAEFEKWNNRKEQFIKELEKWEWLTYSEEVEIRERELQREKELEEE